MYTILKNGSVMNCAFLGVKSLIVASEYRNSCSHRAISYLTLESSTTCLRTAGETITLKSKKQHRPGGIPLMTSNAVPQSISSRAFASIDEQGNREGHNVGTRKSMEFLPSSGAMPASRNPFRFNNVRPANENPFDAAMQAVEETRSRAEKQMSSSFGSRFSPSSTLTPTSLSLRGDKIMHLLAANQNGSIASPSSISHLSRMAANKNPFAFSEKIISPNRGLPFPSRGIMLPQRRMAPEYESNEFLFGTPTVVDVPGALCFRRNVLPAKSELTTITSRNLKRTSDESSHSSDSSCGSRKYARRLGVMSVSDRNNGGAAIGQQQQIGGFDRFRRRQSDESHSISTISQPVPSMVNTISNKSKIGPPMRFFNNGVEVDINGNPIPPSKPPTPEPEPEVDFDTLKDHQASVWDQFIETPKQAEARMKKKKKSRRKKSASAEEKQAEPVSTQVDPTPSALSTDPNKLTTADMDDLVRDSLKEREKTLSAASVLLGFMSQSGTKSSDKQKQTEM